jgi:hypothetical protein
MPDRILRQAGISWSTIVAEGGESQPLLPTLWAPLATGPTAKQLTYSDIMSISGRWPRAGARLARSPSGTLRTTAGPKIIAEFKRGLDDALVRAALVEALGQLDAGQSEAAA